MLACPKGPLEAPDCHASTCCPPVLRSQAHFSPGAHPRRPSSVSNTDLVSELEVTNKSAPNLATLTVQVKPGSTTAYLVGKYLLRRKMKASSLVSETAGFGLLLRESRRHLR